MENKTLANIKQFTALVNMDYNFLYLQKAVVVSPAKQKRDICTAFPASSSSLSSSAAAA